MRNVCTQAVNTCGLTETHKYWFCFPLTAPTENPPPPFSPHTHGVGDARHRIILLVTKKFQNLLFFVSSPTLPASSLARSAFTTSSPPYRLLRGSWSLEQRALQQKNVFAKKKTDTSGSIQLSPHSDSESKLLPMNTGQAYFFSRLMIKVSLFFVPSPISPPSSGTLVPGDLHDDALISAQINRLVDRHMSSSVFEDQSEDRSLENEKS